MGTKALTFCLSTTEQCWWGWRAVLSTAGHGDASTPAHQFVPLLC